MSRLLAVFAALQVLDLASTLWLLAEGGVEANPIAAWLLGHGVAWFVAAKLALAAALVAFIPFFQRPKPPEGERTAAWSCLGMDVAFAAVVASNVAQVLMHG